ncbi:MAG TPA: TolC family protein, partial [Myxococcota bacterium]|nr:TolC family protein [Myxococcota bacterium]
MARDTPRIAPVLAIFAALPACVAPGIGGDVARIRALTPALEFAAIESAAGDPPSDDVRNMLAQPLDAEGAVRISMLNNRELRARLHELGIARGRLMQAGLVANPRVEAEMQPERQSRYELRAEYDIASLLLAPLRAGAAEADLEAERYKVAAAAVQLGYEARAALYAVVAAEQRLGIAQQALDAFAASRDAVVALLQAGNVTPLDAAAQISAYERARITVAQAELEAAQRREALQRLLGLHGDDTRWRVEPALPAAPETPVIPPRTEATAIEASLELAEVRSRLDAIAGRTGLTRVQGWLPELAVDVHSLHGGAEGSQPQGTPWTYGAGVSLSIPLFDREQGTLRAYEAEFDATLERYHGLAIDLRSAAREARARVESAHARARQYQGVILPAQRTLLEQTLLQYNAMQVGVFQLLQARRDELDVELAYIETLREYWTASASLAALLAGRRVATSTTTLAPSQELRSSENGG